MQGGIQFQAALRLLVHRLGVILETVASGLLGLVHGRVGIAQNLLGVLAVVGDHRYADTGPDMKIAPLEREGLPQHMQNLLGHAFHGGRVIDTGEHDQEFVAGQARHHIVGTQAAGQAIRHLDQHQVAGAMTEGIVDLLEAIQIQVHDHGLLALALAHADRLLHAIETEYAVGQAGQGIEIGLLDQLLLVRLALADVFHRQQETAGAAFIAILLENRRDGQHNPETLPAGPTGTDLALPGPPLAQLLDHLVEQLGRVGTGPDQLEQVLPQHFLAVAAGHDFEGVIGFLDPQLGIQHHQCHLALGDGVVQPLQALLALLQIPGAPFDALFQLAVDLLKSRFLLQQTFGSAVERVDQLPHLARTGSDLQLAAGMAGQLLGKFHRLAEGTPRPPQDQQKHAEIDQGGDHRNQQVVAQDAGHLPVETAEVDVQPYPAQQG